MSTLDRPNLFLSPHHLSTPSTRIAILGFPWQLWDPRRKPNAEIRTFTQHFDYISDFLWLEEKKHLVATSADGTLSVMDVRANKTEPIAQSEDQEDELLSIVAIRG